MQLLKTYIVEDSQVIRDSLIAALEEMTPIEVVGVAEDEATAVQWLGESSNAADLVIVDIFLKRGSGLGLLQSSQRAKQQRTTLHPRYAAGVPNWAPARFSTNRTNWRR